MPAGKHTTRLPLYESPRELRLRTWLELARTFHLVSRRVVVLFAEHGLTLPQFDVLATLRFSQGVTQQELAERLLVTKGNVCGLLDRLERNGWVERRPDKDDARVNRLRLTSAGKRKIESVLPEHDDLIVRLFADASDEDVRALRSALVKLAGATGTA